MKIFDRNFVGICHGRTDITVAPLAFLTPYEDNAAGKKRQQTVKDWAGSSWYGSIDQAKTPAEYKTIDNKPKRGFKIVDFADRWSTSNKFARVYDPDGFELEISIANLVDLMLYSVVDHGEIMEDLIWARDGANNRLIPVNSELYKNSLKEGQVLTAEVGDAVIGNHGKTYVYLGTGYVQPVALVGTEVKELIDENEPFRDPYKPYNYTCKPDRVVTQEATGKPEHVYLEEYKWYDETKYAFVTRKKPMKLTANLGKSDIEWGDYDVAEGESFYYSADGNIQRYQKVGRNIEDPCRYWSRNSLFRSKPFKTENLSYIVLEQKLK